MIIILCAMIGIILGILFPYHIPPTFSQYVAMIILAILDSLFGAACAAIRKEFNLFTFISGFLGNSLLAALLTYVGNRLDVELYLVALLVFGTRIFTNFSTIRRHYLAEIGTKLKKKFCN